MLVRLFNIFPPRVWITLSTLVVWTGFIFFLKKLGLVDGNAYRYIIQPLFLIVFSIAVWSLSRHKHSRLRKRNEKTYFLASISLLGIIIYFLSGLIVTYSQNPLISNVPMSILNIVTFSLSAVLLEYARHQTVLLKGRREPFMTGFVMVLVFTLFQLVAINLNFSSGMASIETVSAVILPIIMYNITQTYLAYTAGYGAMIVFAMAWLVIYTLLPIMPNYDWYMTGMSAIVASISVMLLLDRTRQDVDRPISINLQQREKINNWTFASGILILILFMTGVFSYKPVAIMSNSMKPIYSRGDMVIVRQKDDSTEIKKGYIVQYVHNGTAITHRIVDVVDDQGVVKYITKGDNSNSNDPWLVSKDQVVGVVRAKLPFVAYPTVLLHEIL